MINFLDEFFAASNVAFHDVLDFYAYCLPGCFLLACAYLTVRSIVKFFVSKWRKK